jgi:kinesin family protein 3/17
MNSREKTLKSTKCIRMESKAGKCMIAKPDEPMESGKEFTFDAVFDDDSNQTEVYQDIAQDLVDSVLEGYNGTIFAYGQTGCGKSFTMMGVPTDPILCGIIPRAFNQIFTAIKLNAVEKKQFLVQGSYIEIYNEEVRDLLGTNHTARLDLKEHPEKGVYVHGVTKHTVSSVEQITKLMDQGHANRSVGATMMNADSSRSHSIFMVEIETSEPVETTDELSIKQGILNLVDLAGSERAGKTGAEGQRLKEATKINLSLSALGNVISALVSGKGHIPYRDSKLTRLLQNSLGGNAKTVMMAAISPASDNYEESLCTLRYANRAKNIKNKPKVNEDPRDALLREYSDEIKRLKDLLQQSGISAGAAAASAGGSFGGGESASRGVSLGGGLEAEKQRLVDEAQAEIRRYVALLTLDYLFDCIALTYFLANAPPVIHPYSHHSHT